MRKELKDKLNELTTKYENKRQEEKKAQKEKENEYLASLDKFREISQTLIHPILEEIGTKLKAHGHGYQIFESDESVDMEGRTNVPKIGMELFPKGHDKKQYTISNQPSISFSFSKYEKKVTVYMTISNPFRGGTTSGSFGNCHINEIDQSFVEHQTFRFLQQLLDPNPPHRL